STISSRLPERWSQRPTISSVRPLWPSPPYTLAVSKNVTPCSRARSMIAKASSSEVCGPKFMVPRTSRETVAPVRPSWEYCIADHSSKVGGVATSRAGSAAGNPIPGGWGAKAARSVEGRSAPGRGDLVEMSAQGGLQQGAEADTAHAELGEPCEVQTV